MFQPEEKTTRPTEIYPQYIPLVELADNKRSSLGALQHLYAPTSVPVYGPNVKLPVQQVYNINLPGPTGEHTKMSRIYDLSLPGKDNKMTANTVGERLQTFDYIRQIMIQVHDGEDISIDSGGHNNLMSYIKFMELNPNFYSPIQSNPYKSLPFGLLIYRSCFPIEYDQGNHSVSCGKNSIGLNIRLYALTYAEYYSYKFRQLIYKEYDVWRELCYYEYIRENIIKKKQSPNFPLLYAFFLSPNRKIDFFSLKKKCMTQKDILSKDYQKYLEVNVLFGKSTDKTQVNRPLTLPDMARKVIAKLPDEIDPALQAYSGNTLILITEAPHHNLYQWASRIYETKGIVKKMVSHGYYNEDIWLGILFQIVSALYVMQIHGIFMRDMTIEDNIFIKDLQTFGKATKYWKYTIDGISYYVPNYGFVVLIDSNFKDIIPPGTTIDRDKREYKIYTHNIIGKKYKMKQIKHKIFENYRKIINTNSFTNEHTQNNVTKPPENILKLIDNMMKDNEEDLSKVISTHFTKLMNNRIGTYLKKDIEIPHIKEINRDIHIGDILIEQVADSTFKFCMVKMINNNGTVDILTKEDKSPDFIINTIQNANLKDYSNTEVIEQNSTPEVTFSQENLLETYIISS